MCLDLTRKHKDQVRGIHTALKADEPAMLEVEANGAVLGDQRRVRQSRMMRGTQHGGRT